MTRKTEGLSYPAHPLDAIRELQALDAVPPRPIGGVPPPVPPDEPLPTTLPTTLPVSSEVARTTSSEASSATSSVPKAQPKAIRTAHFHETSSAKGESNDSENPVANAMREMLAKRYHADPKKGPFTVSTVKIPTEVWERLGWAATLTDRPKQEIISDALKDYFARLVGRR